MPYEIPDGCFELPLDISISKGCMHTQPHLTDHSHLWITHRHHRAHKSITCHTLSYFITRICESQENHPIHPTREHWTLNTDLFFRGPPPPRPHLALHTSGRFHAMHNVNEEPRHPNHPQSTLASHIIEKPISYPPNYWQSIPTTKSDR